MRGVRRVHLMGIGCIFDRLPCHGRWRWCRVRARGEVGTRRCRRDLLLLLLLLGHSSGSLSALPVGFLQGFCIVLGITWNVRGWGQSMHTCILGRGSRCHMGVLLGWGRRMLPGWKAVSCACRIYGHGRSSPLSGQSCSFVGGIILGFRNCWIVVRTHGQSKMLWILSDALKNNEPSALLSFRTKTRYCTRTMYDTSLSPSYCVDRRHSSSFHIRILLECCTMHYRKGGKPRRKTRQQVYSEFHNNDDGSSSTGIYQYWCYGFLRR